MGTLVWSQHRLYTPDDGYLSIGVAGPVVGILGPYILIGGGANFPAGMPWDDGVKRYHQQVKLYRASDTGIMRAGGFSLSFPVAYAGAASTPLGIVYAGGEDQQGATARAHLLVLEKATDSIREKRLPDLPHPATNGALVAHDSVVYFIGGQHREKLYDQIWMLDLRLHDPNWVQVGRLPSARTSFFTSLYTHQGVPYLFICGGRQQQPERESLILQDAHTLNLRTGKWSSVPDFPSTIAAGSAVFIPGLGVLCVGGDIGEVYRKTENIIHAIQKESNPSIRSALMAARKQIQLNHPGFDRKVWLFKPDDNKWHPMTEVPYPTPVTTQAIFYADKVIIPSGELKPGIRSEHILFGTFKKSEKNK